MPARSCSRLAIPTHHLHHQLHQDHFLVARRLEPLPANRCCRSGPGARTKYPLRPSPRQGQGPCRPGQAARPTRPEFPTRPEEFLTPPALPPVRTHAPAGRPAAHGPERHTVCGGGGATGFDELADSLRSLWLSRTFYPLHQISLALARATCSMGSLLATYFSATSFPFQICQCRPQKANPRDRWIFCQFRPQKANP